MKLLVMGAGYVGMALLESLQSQLHEIYITTTDLERVNRLKSYGERVLLLNLNDDKDLHDLMSECEGMVILVAPKNSQNYEETYLKTAKRVFSGLQNRKTSFYVLYLNSTSVCEGLNDMWVTEELPLRPTSERAKILLEAEQIYLKSNASVCILRLGGIYGPFRELADRARRFSGKLIPGTGNEPTNYIHLEDIVRAILFCLNHSLKGVYHLVNDDHPTRKEVYSALCQRMNIPIPLWNPVSSQEIRGGYKISNQKIKEAGFTFKHPLTNLN